ncbi:MAG: CoA ester lyase [Pseudomonadota bacterium]
MRSLLFVPGDSERKLEKGLASGADALLIDLEDSVAPDNKKLARETCCDFLRANPDRLSGPALYVRVNAFDSALTDDDLGAIMSGRPDGIMLPKSNHGNDVTRLSAKLAVQEAENNLDEGTTRIIAIATETAEGTLHCATYKGASDRLIGMSWGAEDLAADVGAREKRHIDGTYRDLFRHARLQCLLGAVAAGVQPIDTVYTDFRNSVGLRKECEEAAIDGFTGKMAIHPAQVPAINEAFTPDKAAIDRAQRIVETFENAGNPGVIGLDGEMLDQPHLKLARSLIDRARLAGVLPR